MKKRMLHTLIHWRILIVLVAMVVMALGPVTFSSGQVRNPGPRILPPNALIYGKTHSKWSAEWWKWVFSIPAPVNPLLDDTGAFCDQGQSGPVWFLAGSWGAATVTRTCTVPAGKPIFFPIVNCANDPVGVDPPPTVDELYAGAEWFIDNCACMACEIDAVPVLDMESYRAQSPVFSFTLPTQNPLVAVPPYAPGMTVHPAVADGYYLMLAPPTVGHHVIHFTGVFPGGGPPLDITYNLTVTR